MIGFSFHPEAERELDEAFGYYESRVPTLGQAFLTEVERTVALIRRFPDAAAPAGPARRKAAVARFPYSIIYLRDVDAIVVIAVAHQKRRPGYWRGRA